jgi:hypothetical protein
VKKKIFIKFDNLSIYIYIYIVRVFKNCWKINCIHSWWLFKYFFLNPTKNYSVAVSQDITHQSSFISYLCKCTLCVFVISIDVNAFMFVYFLKCLYVYVSVFGCKFRFHLQNFCLWCLNETCERCSRSVYEFMFCYVRFKSYFLLQTVGVPYSICVSKLYKVSEHESQQAVGSPRWNTSSIWSVLKKTDVFLKKYKV